MSGIFYVPKAHSNLYKKLYNLRTDDFEEIISKIENIPINLSQKKMEKYLAELLKIHLIEAENFLEIIDISTKIEDKKETDKEDFLTQLIDFIEENVIKDKIDREKFYNIIKRLAKINGNFAIINKAADLSLAREKIFLDARIITDLRPVFKSDIKDDIDGYVICHNLEIKLKEYKRTKNIFIALDNEDLKKLKEILDRAEDKEKILISKYDNKIFFKD